VSPRARGTGSIFQARYKDRHGQWRTARTWSIQFYDRRRRDHVSEGGFRSKEAAEAALRAVLDGAAHAGDQWKALSLALVRRRAGAPIEISGREFNVLRGPIAYAWFCGEIPMYVGSSTNGFLRVLDVRHHALKVATGDRVRIWPCDTVEGARAMERRLIRELRPQINTQRAWGRSEP
jgi:hypothetical protein